MVKNNVVSLNRKGKEGSVDKEVQNALEFLPKLRKDLQKGDYDKCAEIAGKYIATMKDPLDTATFVYSLSGDCIREAYLFLAIVLEEIHMTNGSLDDETLAVFEKNILQNSELGDEPLNAALSMLMDFDVDKDFFMPYAADKSPADLLAGMEPLLLSDPFKFYLSTSDLAAHDLFPDEESATAFVSHMSENLNNCDVLSFLLISPLKKVRDSLFKIMKDAEHDVTKRYALRCADFVADSAYSLQLKNMFDPEKIGNPQYDTAKKILITKVDGQGDQSLIFIMHSPKLKQYYSIHMLFNSDIGLKEIFTSEYASLKCVNKIIDDVFNSGNMPEDFELFEVSLDFAKNIIEHYTKVSIDKETGIYPAFPALGEVLPLENFAPKEYQLPENIFTEQKVDVDGIFKNWDSYKDQFFMNFVPSSPLIMEMVSKSLHETDYDEFFNKVIDHTKDAIVKKLEIVVGVYNETEKLSDKKCLGAIATLKAVAEHRENSAIPMFQNLVTKVIEHHEQEMELMILRSLVDPEDELNEKYTAELISTNNKLLKEFEKSLKEKKLKESTIKTHMESVTFFKNEFLNNDDPLQADEAFMYLDEFFSDYVSENETWSKPAKMKQMITSIKKFYAFLHEIDYIDDEDMKDFRDAISGIQTEWGIK